MRMSSLPKNGEPDTSVVARATASEQHTIAAFNTLVTQLTQL